MSESTPTERSTLVNPPDLAGPEKEIVQAEIEEDALADKKEKTEKSNQIRVENNGIEKRNNKKKPGQWKNAKQNTWMYEICTS